MGDYAQEQGREGGHEYLSQVGTVLEQFYQELAKLGHEHEDLRHEFSDIDPDGSSYDPTLAMRLYSLAGELQTGEHENFRLTELFVVRDWHSVLATIEGMMDSIAQWGTERVSHDDLHLLLDWCVRIRKFMTYTEPHLRGVLTGSFHKPSYPHWMQDKGMEKIRDLYTKRWE